MRNYVRNYVVAVALAVLVLATTVIVFQKPTPYQDSAQAASSSPDPHPQLGTREQHRASVTAAAERIERATQEREFREILEKLGQIQGERRVTQGGVTTKPSDGTSQAFMALALSCGSSEVSMREFLSMRVAQARSAGIAQSYVANSIVFGADNVVILSEHTGRPDGSAIIGFPRKIDYFYVVDWSGARLARTEPETNQLDPVSFMKRNPDPICNSMIAARHRAEQRAQADAPPPPTPELAVQDAPSSDAPEDQPTPVW